MPLMDQWQVLDDSITLSAGQTVKFDMQAWCLPFSAPSDADVAAAFDSTSLQLVSSSADSLSLENGATVQATVKEVVTVGALRAQILAAGNKINAAKSIPCSNFAIVNNEIDLLIQRGDGSAALPLSTGVPMSLIALAVIALIGFAVWREIYG